MHAKKNDPMTVGALDPSARAFYCRAMRGLTRAGVRFLVGGAYAFNRYTGIERHTKDFDVFVRPGDCDRVLRTFEELGCRAELTFPHWLGKAFCGDDFVDVIFSSGNGLAAVDDAWFEHAVSDRVLGVPVKLIPIEEMIWQKAFIMERERFDGADVAHLLRARCDDLDWDRLVGRFGPHWRVLLAHLILFGFIYPSERRRIPSQVVQGLMDRVRDEQAQPADGEAVCQGTLISRAQYLVDVDHWGYTDARLTPASAMTSRDITHWTAAIDNGA